MVYRGRMLVEFNRISVQSRGKSLGTWLTVGNAWQI